MQTEEQQRAKIAELCEELAVAFAAASTSLKSVAGQVIRGADINECEIALMSAMDKTFGAIDEVANKAEKAKQDAKTIQ